MQIDTPADLLLTKEFWILGVIAGILANAILMLLWKGRNLVLVGIRFGLAHRKGYLQAREHFVNSVARRENVDILSFLVINFFLNTAIAFVSLVLAGGLLAFAFSTEGYALLVLAPTAIIFLLYELTFLVTSLEKYYIAQHGMTRVLQEVIKPGGPSQQVSADDADVGETAVKKTERTSAASKVNSG